MIISITLFVLGVLCICLFFIFGKNEKIEKTNKDKYKEDNKEEVDNKDAYDEFGNKIVVVYNSKEEVYDVIVDKYLGRGETIIETREENGCWYYKSSNGKDEYEYCIAEPIIRIYTTEITNIK